jgi:autotransporter-associated beta strand protein
LASRDESHTIEGGIFLNSGTLRITDDLNLGAGKSANSNFVILRGGTFEVFNSAVTLGAARFVNVDRGGGAIMTTGSAAVLNILGNDQLQGGTLGGLEKTGQGTLVVGGSNSFAGPVTLSHGVLELQQPNSLGTDNRSAISLAGSTTLNLHSNSDALNFNNDITLAGNALIDFARLDKAMPGGNFFLNQLTTPAGVPAPGTLTLNNSSRDGSLIRFLGPVQLGSSLTLNITSGSSAALNGGIQGGSVGLTKTGLGTLVIDGAVDNRFSSPVTAIAGTLALAKTGGGVAVPSDLLINGALVRLDGNNQIADSSNITLFQGTFNVNGRGESATSLTMSGGSLVTGVGGRLVLTLPAGAAVPSSFPGGPVAAPAVPALNISGGVTTINTGGEINATTVQVSGGVNTVQPGGQFTMGSGGLTFAGNLSPNITFMSDGANPGRLSITGSVTYTGTAGVASLTSTGALPLAGTIDLNGAQRDFSVGDDGTSAVDMLISATITNGSLKKSGAGTLRLTGANTYTGGTTISAGILEIGSPAALGSGALTFNSGQLNLRADAVNTVVNTPLISTSSDVILSVDRDTVAGGTSGSVSFGGGLSLAANQLMVTGANRSVTFTGQTTLTGTGKINAATTAVDVAFSSPIVQSAGIFGVTKDGPGKVTFQGAAANTYTGTTRVQGGTLVLNKTAGVNAVPANLDVLVGGTARLMAANQIVDTSAVTVNIGGTLDLNGNSETIASLNGTGGSITLGGGTLTVTQGTYPGVIGGGGMVVQENPAGGTSAILTLSGLQTFTGGVIVNHGSVNFSLQAPGHTGTTLNAGIWRAFNGSSLNFNAGSNVTTNNAEVVLSGATSTFAKINSLASNGGTFTISGGKTFTAVGALSNSGTLTVGTGSTLTVNNNFTNTGNATITGSLVAAGIINTSGNLTLNGPQQYAVATSMNVTAGTTAINTDAGAPATYRLSINGSGGALQFGATQHLSNLTLSGAATLGTAPGTVSTGPFALVTQALSTSGNGTFDLTNNALIVDYTGATTVPFNAVKAAIFLAYNTAGTHWAGHGITSATAAANSTAYGIGYAEASAALNISGAQTAPFRGQTVDATSVLARFTKLGDSTLDGTVDFNDLVKLAQNYNSSGTTWNTGDFTYDGTTDFNDLVKLAQNYNTALPGEPIPGAPVGFDSDMARAFAQVPEPSTFAVISVLGLGILSRRHRRAA